MFNIFLIHLNSDLSESTAAGLGTHSAFGRHHLALFTICASQSTGQNIVSVLRERRAGWSFQKSFRSYKKILEKPLQKSAPEAGHRTPQNCNKRRILRWLQAVKEHLGENNTKANKYFFFLALLSFIMAQGAGKEQGGSHISLLCQRNPPF